MNEIENQNIYIKKVKEKNMGKRLYYTVLTMGCQLNENDSEKLSGMMEQMGYEKNEEQGMADVYIINTCCVRENAEEKLFRKTWRIKNLQD